MTNEKAAKYIIRHCNPDYPALERHIPKKPKYKAEDRFVKNHFTEYSYCPVCGKEVVSGAMFCVMCGQAMDFSEWEG